MNVSFRTGGVVFVLGWSLFFNPTIVQSAVIFEDSFEIGLSNDDDIIDWTTTVEGWVLAGIGGTYNPVPSQPQPLHDPGLAPEHRNLIYLQGVGTTLSKDIGVPWAPNTLYTLHLDYWASNTTASTQFTFHLQDANGDVAAATPEFLVQQTEMFTYSNVVSFVSGDVAPTGNILLQVSSSGIFQYHFDHFVLEAIPVPEPDSILFMGMGMSFVMTAARRRRPCH